MGVWLGLLILSQDTGQMFVLTEHTRDSLIAILLALGHGGDVIGIDLSLGTIQKF